MIKRILLLLLLISFLYGFHDWVSWQCYGGSRILYWCWELDHKKFAGPIEMFVQDHIYGRYGWEWAHNLKLLRYL